MSLKDARIVLGVSGGIAAYKSVEICRRLVDAGAHVSPVMTKGATKFLGEATLSALASVPVQTELWGGPHPIPHTRLGQNADLILVAPATARVIAAYAIGLSTDLLTNTLLATRAPVVLCPAMHTEMWEHPAVADNLRLLKSRGVIIVDPEAGRLAGGDLGTGRLASPERILAAVSKVLGPQDLQGLKVAISAGGTREPIDAVRVIANRSSGKQGYALAVEAAGRGAQVTLVSTVDLPVPVGVEVVRVETAEEMRAAMTAAAASCDVIIMAAAVADFRPVHVVGHKIKKSGGLPEIFLEPTPDILAGLAASRQVGQTLVGFAAETDELIAHAQQKLISKNVDLIVANDVSAPLVGFTHDTNAVTLLTPDHPAREVPLSSKADIAAAVWEEILRIRSRGVAASSQPEGDHA
jgi:phosphopantothenoylcysteine decarboxylase/phosphopantothenate--cysteine ligase